MHDSVRKYVDEEDVEGLKYVMVDALDVDPTFEKYREDFNAIASHGLFEPHKELSGFNSSSSWDMAYWKKLKKDILSNFSEKRMKHMIEVAKVIYADEIKREQEKVKLEPKKAQPDPATAQKTADGIKMGAGKPQKSKAEQDRELEEDRRKLAAENAATAQKEAQKKTTQKEGEYRPPRVPKQSSKGLPILPIIIAAAVILLIIVMILK